MIKASEAEKLVVTSDINIEKYLSLIEAKIVAIASEGKRSYACYIDGLWKSCDVYGWTHYLASPAQKAVSEKLKALGYKVTLCRDGAEYVPSRLADDIGEGPLYVNVCLIINW